MNVPAFLRTRVRVIQAIRWTGENAAAIEGFAGPNFTFDPAVDGAAVLNSTHSAWVPVYVGDWVARDQDGRWFRLDPADLERDYERIGGPA